MDPENSRDPENSEDSPAAGAIAWRRQLRQSMRDRPFPPDKIQPPPVPGHGAPVVKVGIFAGIHGDEPAGSQTVRELAAWARRRPEELAGFELTLFPVCNPYGCKAGTRHSPCGMDLNREFWTGSDQCEVRALEKELRAGHFHLIVALHEDDTSEGLYGFAGDHPLSHRVLAKSLSDASLVLPVNAAPVIDGFSAAGGIITEGYSGILTAPPEQRPRAVEIVFETPALAPMARRVVAGVVAVKSMLLAYRELTAASAQS
ncbi:MAG: succinylglutamate desuccinylase/aspartoacylase family protein [Verrucomicrobiota bacterium]